MDQAVKDEAVKEVAAKDEAVKSAEPAAPAKGIQVTDNALKKIRSAMVKENISPEQVAFVWACRAADARA